MSIAIEKPWKKLATAMSGAGRAEEVEPGICHGLAAAEVCLLSSLPGCVTVHAQNGRMIWANAMFKSAHGLTETADLADQYFDGMNPQDRVVVMNAISQSIEGADSCTVEFKRQGCASGDGSSIRSYEVQVSTYTRETVGGTPLVLALTRETTDVHAQLVELKDKLRQSEIERVERNRFFTSMSHELRTPLNAIIGFSELLEGKAAIKVNDAKKLEYAGVINDSANHLLSLINDILDLSKLEEGKQEKSDEEFSLRELLQTTVRTMMPAAMEKQIDLVLDCEADLPAIHSDSRVLRQIFTNLVSNAVKFSHAGDEVRLKVTRLRNRYKISVIDQGIGMDAETLSRLGGVFYQSGDVIRGDYEGSGLGLSIVFKLVELIGGKVAVNSKPGTGTTVSVILPTGGSSAKPVPDSSHKDVVYLHPDQCSKNGLGEVPNQAKGML